MIPARETIMANQKKKDTVVSLTEEIKAHDALALADYVGITHQQLEELRNTLRKSDGNIRVTKNALLLLALKEAGVNTENIKLSGATAVIMAKTTNLSPFKTIYDKGKELEMLVIKGGIWEKQLVSADHIIRLSTLPSIDQLRAQLVGSLQSPLSKMVYALKGNLQKLVITLDQIRAQKS